MHRHPKIGVRTRPWVPENLSPCARASAGNNVAACESREPKSFPNLLHGQRMRGDLDLERLVDQHYAALYRFALSLAGHESDACDLVQETFFLLTTKGHQLADPSKVKSWLFTTLYRLFTGGRARLDRFSPHPVAGVGEGPEMPAEPAHPVGWEGAPEYPAGLAENLPAAPPA